MKDITFIRYVESSDNYYNCEFNFLDEIGYGKEGLALLIQLVIYELLKTPGRDAINPKDGGGFLELAKGVYDIGNVDEIEVRFALAVQSVEAQILANQLLKNYPANETLKSLKVGDKLEFDQTSLTLTIGVKIESMAGENVGIEVPISSTLLER